MTLHWASPWWWLLAPALLLVLRPERGASLPFSSLALFEPPVSPSLRQRFLWLPPVLRLLALTLLVAALARPRTPDQSSAVWEPLRAVLLCVDTSGSMGAIDSAGPEGPRARLDLVKLFLDRFLHERREFAGLIAFGATPRVVSPPTTDHHALRHLAAELAVDTFDNRTNIGDALALAIELLQRTPAAEHRILLATDGAHNVPTGLAPGTAARIAAAFSIRIDTVAVGGTDRPAADLPDQAALKAMADWTGGHYYRAANPADLDRLATPLAQPAGAPIRLLGYRQWRDWFAELIAAALLLLALEQLLKATWLRVLPE